MIGQFSSIGSMGLDKTKWLAGEFQRTMTTLGKSSLRSDPPVHLVSSSMWSVACVTQPSSAVRQKVEHNGYFPRMMLQLLSLCSLTESSGYLCCRMVYTRIFVLWLYFHTCSDVGHFLKKGEPLLTPLLLLTDLLLVKYRIFCV